MIGTNTSHPYKIFKSKNVKKKRKKNKRDIINKCKSQSPGVPPNTCPYIDLTITIVKDIAQAYDDMYAKGNHNPVVHKMEDTAIELLEYIRTNNETLRDNSHFWYTEYKNHV